MESPVVWTALVDGSGLITVGGTAQTLFAARAYRRYLLVQNLHASDPLWINFGVTAVADAPSIKIAAGATFIMDGSIQSNQLISIIGPTTNQKFTAKEA